MPTVAQMIMTPNTMFIGKPTEIMFSCGAILLMTPKAILTIKRAITAGSANSMPFAIIHDPDRTKRSKPSGVIPDVPTGNSVKLSTTMRIIAR